MTKTALITGPTNGIGRETALELARRGYKLFLLCRNRELGEQLCEEISALPEAPPAPHLLVADLGNLDDVRNAASEFLDTGEPLHVLINNAGIVNMKRQLVTVAGEQHEQMFAVNHLGHFLLTQLLLPRLKESAPARIVVVSSEAHAFCKSIQFDDLTFEKNYATFKTYGHSKLANILMVKQLAKRLEGSDVMVNALHPGAISSNLGKNNAAWYTPIITGILKFFFLTPKQGADTSIYLATTDEVSSSGNYYYKRKIHRLKPWAEDDSAAEKLWAVSEQLVAN